MTKKIHAFLLLVFALSLSLGCVSSAPKRPAKILLFEGEAGRVIPNFGIAIDANYDRRLDGLISNYKLLPVSIRNVSPGNLPMDIKKDRWVIVSEKGKRYRAINSLRHKEPVVWRELPEKFKSAVEYPEFVPTNYAVTFDLFFPKAVNLEYFQTIRYFNATLKQEFVLEKVY